MTISKRKAYLFAFLLSLPPCIADASYNLFVISGRIPNALWIDFLVGLLIGMSFVSAGLFIYFATKQSWIQYLWIPLAFQFMQAFVTFIYYAVMFQSVDNDFYCLPSIQVTSLLLFLLFIFISYLAFFLFLFVSRPICAVLTKRFTKLPKLFYLLFYLYWFYNSLVSRVPSEYRFVHFMARIYHMNTNILNLFLTFILLLFVLFVYSTFSKRKFLTMENSLLKDQVQSQYNHFLTLSEQEEKMRKLYHDIGNHISALELLVENGNTQQAKSYVKDLSDQFRNLRKNRFTNHPTVDAVLSQKTELCERYHIQLEIDMILPSVLSISDIDLVSVFSNLFDNAIEACLRNPDVSNYINLKTSCSGDYIVIKMENSKPASTNSKAPLTTWKKDSRLHGYGLKIINEITERYQGQKMFDVAKDTFTATVMLNYKTDQLEQQKTG